jgi:DNA-binding NarL/FixJ family response regulator
MKPGGRSFMAAALHDSSESSAPFQDRPRGRLCVVVVDDSPVVRERIERMVAAIPTTSVVAAPDNTEDALEAIAREKPDVVLLDIELHGHGGLELLRELVRKPDDIKVVAYSNCAEPLVRKRLLRAGAHQFFDLSREFLEMRAFLRALVQDATR